MRSASLTACAALLGALTFGNPSAALIADQPAHPELLRIIQTVSPEALKATVTRLVSFGTRHTMSDTVSPTRGIGAARRWVKGQFEGFGAACHGCLTIDTPEQTVTGARIPTPTVIQDVLSYPAWDR